MTSAVAPDIAWYLQDIWVLISIILLFVSGLLVSVGAAAYFFIKKWKKYGIIVALLGLVLGISALAIAAIIGASTVIQEQSAALLTPV